MFEPLQEVIEGWKKEYGKVYCQEVGGTKFYFRRLLRPEYREKIFGIPGTTPEREEKICELCVLHPKDYDFSGPNAPAGVATTLAEAILDCSGFALKELPKEL